MADDEKTLTAEEEKERTEYIRRRMAELTAKTSPPPVVRPAPKPVPPPAPPIPPFSAIEVEKKGKIAVLLKGPAGLEKPIMPEKGIFNLALPFDPTKGGKLIRNPSPLSVGGISMLCCVSEQVRKSPEYKAFAKAFRTRDENGCAIAPAHVVLSTGENRKMTGTTGTEKRTRRWSNQEQLKDFDELAHWRPTKRYKFAKEDPKKKGKFHVIERTEAWPFAGPSRIDRKKQKRPGPPDKAGERFNPVLEMWIDEATTLILYYNIYRNQLYRVSASLGRMTENERKLYFQALPFIGSGWLCKYDFACQVLYCEVKEQTGFYWSLIENALKGLMEKTGWERDLKAEGGMRKNGVLGSGHNRGWYLHLPARNKIGQL